MSLKFKKKWIERRKWAKSSIVSIWSKFIFNYILDTRDSFLILLFLPLLYYTVFKRGKIDGTNIEYIEANGVMMFHLDYEQNRYVLFRRSSSNSHNYTFIKYVYN